MKTKKISWDSGRKIPKENYDMGCYTDWFLNYVSSKIVGGHESGV